MESTPEYGIFVSTTQISASVNSILIILLFICLTSNIVYSNFTVNKVNDSRDRIGQKYLDNSVPCERKRRMIN